MQRIGSQRWTRRVALGWIILLGFTMTVDLRAADTGDFDGDGRLTLSDLLHSLDQLPPAPNSRDAFLDHPCGGDTNWSQPRSTMFEGLTFIEILRRAVPDGMPHWDPVWPVGEGDNEEPLPADGGVLVEILEVSAMGADDDRARLELLITTVVPVRSFALIVEAEEDILRVPYRYSNGAWSPKDWRELSHFSEGSARHSDGDLGVNVAFPSYLITGGRFVIHYGLIRSGFSTEPLVSPGTYRIEVETRLPKGASAGTYNLSVLPTSQVVVETGPVAPTVVAGGSLEILNDVTVGYDGGIPPLRPDPESQTVEGAVEFRIGDATGRPGEEVALPLELRTDVPLNAVSFSVEWAQDALECGSLELEFANSNDGVVYLPDEHIGRQAVCAEGWVLAGPKAYAFFLLRGGTRTSRDVATYPDRPLAYFEPLGEWTPVATVTLKIPECAAGGDVIPVRFAPFDPDRPFNYPYAQPAFLPYESIVPCEDDWFNPSGFYWEHEVRYENAEVTVEDVAPAPGCGGPPPDIGARFVVGEASGRPGDVVEVPILAATDAPVSSLRLALEVDPTYVEVQAIDVEMERLRNGEFIREQIPRSERFGLVECDPAVDPDLPPDCFYSVPALTIFYDSAPEYVAIDQLTLPPDGMTTDSGYPGSELREVGRLLVRIREDAPVTDAGAVVDLRAATIDNVSGVGSVATGAFLTFPDTSVFSPVSEFSGGKIRILGAGFRRGDANGDRDVNLSDALTVLNFLFLGGSDPSCDDAADTDDSGVIELTDGVFALNALFLGGDSLPPPVECGHDPSQDELECEDGACGE